MHEQLQRSYHRQMLLVLVAFVAAMLVRALHLIDPGRWTDAPEAALWFFILSIALAAAAPVFLRALFAHRIRQAKSVSKAVFFRFQNRLIRTALMTPYLALAVCLMEMPRFYQAGIVLATLYALYYSYPSKRRIDFDRRVFRVA